MYLIFGGAYQGKLTWAVEKFKLSDDELCDLALSDPLPGKRCYYHLEAWTARCPTASADVFDDDTIVISREIGAGVVPLEPETRLWREKHGALLQALATRASGVTRIFCGFSQTIK